MAGYSTTTGNRLSAGAGYTFTYDNEGNTTSKTFDATGAKTDYTWDYRNRLTGVMERNSGGTVIMQATYTYDPLGRRIGVNVDDDGAGPHAAEQSWTVYDGDNTYADFDGSGTLSTRYLYGPAIDALLARTSSGGTTAWYMTDRLGSVRDVVDTSGTVLDHVSYDSYGNILTESNAGNGDRFKFTAREFDAQIKLQFNRARLYSTLSGRFMSEDPIGFQSLDTNFYRYIDNQVTQYVDPLGNAKRLPPIQNQSPWDPNFENRLPNHIYVDSVGKLKGADETYERLRRITVADMNDDCEGAWKLVAVVAKSIRIRELEQGRSNSEAKRLSHQTIINKELDLYRQMKENFLKSDCGFPGGGEITGPYTPIVPKLPAKGEAGYATMKAYEPRPWYKVEKPNLLGPPGSYILDTSGLEAPSPSTGAGSIYRPHTPILRPQPQPRLGR